VEFQIKGNPMCKKAPTLQKLHVIEKSPDTLRIRGVNTTSDVPYGDCFYVQEDFLVKGHPQKPNGKGCMVQ